MCAGSSDRGKTGKRSVDNPEKLSCLALLSTEKNPAPFDFSGPVIQVSLGFRHLVNPAQWSSSLDIGRGGRVEVGNLGGCCELPLPCPLAWTLPVFS